MQNNTFSGLFVGQNVVRLARIDSTNNFLKSQLSNSTPVHEGTVILAEEQLAGRGQQNNVWHSHPGKNLTFSILLKPSFLNIGQQFLLNKAISIAINEVLETIIGKEAKIKWPNDLYVSDKKVGGILIENILQGDKWKYAIIGIGLNVNQASFPPGLTNATSLIKILHTDYDLEILLSQICNNIEAWYLKLKFSKINDIEQTYISKLYRLNKETNYRSKDEILKGSLVNVNQLGQLELKCGNDIKCYNVKEIEFLN